MVLLDIFRKILDDDRIVTRTVDDLVTLLISHSDSKNHILGKDEINENEGCYEIGLNHQTLVVINLVRNGELVKDVYNALCIQLTTISEQVGD